MEENIRHLCPAITSPDAKWINPLTRPKIGTASTISLDDKEKSSGIKI
jgi:hypothetical protein